MSLGDIRKELRAIPGFSEEDIRKICGHPSNMKYELNHKKGTRPCTYRRKMDTRFLDYSKKKRKSKAIHRKMNRRLLECVNRDLRHMDELLDIFEAEQKPFPFTPKEQKMLWVIRTIYTQQKRMYDEKSNSTKDRIVSVFQPPIRPIPRGKINAKIKFG